MIDCQIYNGEKCINHLSNVWWMDMHNWLNEKEAILKIKNKVFTGIDIQVYSWQDMPVDSLDKIKTFEEAHDFLKNVLARAERGEYQFTKVIK